LSPIRPSHQLQGPVQQLFRSTILKNSATAGILFAAQTKPSTPRSSSKFIHQQDQKTAQPLEYFSPLRPSHQLQGPVQQLFINNTKKQRNRWNTFRRSDQAINSKVQFKIYSSTIPKNSSTDGILFTAQNKVSTPRSSKTIIQINNTKSQGQRLEYFYF
jgi:hypothetical protein